MKKMTFLAPRSRAPALIGTLTVGAALLGLAHSAFAQSQAQISIRGTVLPGTCDVQNIDRTLTTVAASDFPAPAAQGMNMPQSQLPLQLLLRNCLGVTGASITFGTNADGDAVNPGIFRNIESGQDASAGFGLRFYHNSDCTGSTTPSGPGKTLTLDTNNQNEVDVDLCVVYHTYPAASGIPVKAGSFASQFVATISYR
jgi:type 1 fimbria pilin